VKPGKSRIANSDLFEMSDNISSGVTFGAEFYQWIADCPELKALKLSLFHKAWIVYMAHFKQPDWDMSTPSWDELKVNAHDEQADDMLALHDGGLELTLERVMPAFEALKALVVKGFNWEVKGFQFVDTIVCPPNGAYTQNPLVLDVPPPVPPPPSPTDEESDSEIEEDHVAIYKCMSVTPVDLSKMNIKCCYKYLVANMSPAAKLKFNSILEMGTEDLTQIAWALRMGNCAMMSRAMTPEEIAEAADLDDSFLINPYECMNVLSDTISTRVIANRGNDFYMDPGTTDCQIIICRIGAVVTHTKHNVAFGVEENQYLLTRFMKIYSLTNPDVVSAIRAKMALLPTDRVHGVYMKYRPKRSVFTYTDYTGKKVKDYNRFEIEMSQHGSYPKPQFSPPKNVNLLALAMTTVGSSPLALFSVFSHSASGRRMMFEFERDVAANLQKVEVNQLVDYYRHVERVLNGEWGNTPTEMYEFGMLNQAFETSYMLNVVPIIAKDKGIWNDLRRVLNPYGSVTLALAIALRDLDATFATKKWITFNSTDVANMLKLKIFTTDAHAAPNRVGNTVPAAPNVADYVVRSRKWSTAQNVITYNVPLLSVSDIALDKPNKDKEGKPIVPPFRPAYCLMDLAFNGKLYEISDSAYLEKQRSSGNLRSSMDYFYHDRLDSKVCFPNLFHVDSNNKLVADYQMFVVVAPLVALDVVYLKKLMTVYKIRVVLGSPAMNFSVYLVGCKDNTAKYHPLVRHWAAHLILSRMKLYNKLYSGYLDEARDAVRESHRILESSLFVSESVDSRTDKEFLSSFKRSTAAPSISVLDAINPVDFSVLSTTLDDF
jgi:hypothetical protein